MKHSDLLRVMAKIARIGDKILAGFAFILVMSMLLYGGYALGDTVAMHRGAYISKELLKYKPALLQEGDAIAFEELAKVNPDVCAWLTIDGTNIDYPMVQGETNMEYINKDVFGEYSVSGAIFLDRQNKMDFTDSYNLTYGHHMKNGAMFGDVVEFLDEDYFEKHKTGTLYLPEGNYHIRIFACVKTDAFDWTIFTPGVKQEDISEFLKYVKEKSVQYREIGVIGKDRIIGLSTCYEAETNGRVIVFGKLEKKNG